LQLASILIVIKQLCVTMRIYVGNLDERIEDSHLLEAFSEFGKVEKAHIQLDKYTQKSACYGFVEMPIYEEAQFVIAKVNGAKWEGKKLIVKKAFDKK